MLRVQICFLIGAPCWAPVQTGCVLEMGHSCHNNMLVCLCMFVCCPITTVCWVCLCMRVCSPSCRPVSWVFYWGGRDSAVCFCTISLAKLVLPDPAQAGGEGQDTDFWSSVILGGLPPTRKHVCHISRKKKIVQILMYIFDSNFYSKRTEASTLTAFHVTILT